MARSAKAKPAPSLVLERQPHRSDGRNSNQRKRPQNNICSFRLVCIVAVAVGFLQSVYSYLYNSSVDWNTRDDLLVPSSSMNSSHREAWVEQLRKHAEWLSEQKKKGVIKATKDGATLAATPAGHAQQLNMQRRQQASVPIIVAREAGRGLGVFYAGDAPLPKGSLASLFRCLLLRRDLLEQWVGASGVLDTTAEVTGFWERYGITFADEEQQLWTALPLGEISKQQAWWALGPLNEAQLMKARAAHDNMKLPDWSGTPGRRWPDPKKGEGPFLFTGHLFNEPSDEEPETIESLRLTVPCNTFGESIRACGAVLEARTKREVLPGEPFLWCYGGAYKRTYPIARQCGGGA